MPRDLRSGFELALQLVPRAFGASFIPRGSLIPSVIRRAPGTGARRNTASERTPALKATPFASGF